MTLVPGQQFYSDLGNLLTIHEVNDSSQVLISWSHVNQGKQFYWPKYALIGEIQLNKYRSKKAVDIKQELDELLS